MRHLINPRFLGFVLFLSSGVFTHVHANPSLELEAWGTFSGIQSLAQQVSTDQYGGVNLGILDGDSRSVLKDHLGSVKRILTSNKTSFTDRKTHLEITASLGQVGKLAGRLGKTQLIYSPFELAVMGADAAYDDLDQQLFISPESAISGSVDIATAHEFLHHQVSSGAYPELPWSKLIFFVDQKGKSLRKEAIYYGTFLRTDEVLAHLQDIVCYSKIKDTEIAAQKAEVLKEILLTLSQLPSKFATAQKGSSPLRKGREVLRAGHLRLDLNGLGSGSLTSLKTFVDRLLGVAQENKIERLVAEGKMLKLGTFCPGRYWDGK